MAAEYLNVAATARLVRQALGEAYPAVRFTVVGSTYSKGASIDVQWWDGPTERDVATLVAPFRGASSPHTAPARLPRLDGKLTRFAPDHVTCSRDYSDEAVRAAIEDVMREHALDFEASHQPAPTVDQFRRGKCWRMVLNSQRELGGDVQQLIYGVLTNKRFGEVARPSTTVSRVKAV